jgi:Glycosyl transferase family 2
MSQPTVCAIMLVNGRHEMVRRAVASFRAQTYEAKRLLLWDTGEPPFDNAIYPPGIHHVLEGGQSKSIGALRNDANDFAIDAEIFIHWDSDDWAHPRRIEEQVALLQASGKECVGYREVLFWDSVKAPKAPNWADKQEAWLYTNNDPRYCIGASLCYWRAAWERRLFPDLPKAKGGTGEDTEFLREVNSLGIPAIPWDGDAPHRGWEDMEDEPRLICAIHGGNSQHYDPAGYVAQGSQNWKRVEAWDTHCRDRMAL